MFNMLRFFKERWYWKINSKCWTFGPRITLLKFKIYAMQTSAELVYCSKLNPGLILYQINMDQIIFENCIIIVYHGLVTNLEFHTRYSFYEIYRRVKIRKQLVYVLYAQGVLKYHTNSKCYNYIFHNFIIWLAVCLTWIATET